LGIGYRVLLDCLAGKSQESLWAFPLKAPPSASAVVYELAQKLVFVIVKLTCKAMCVVLEVKVFHNVYL
jgi:hypothetical protein